jgi:hypothetical protein
MTEHKYIRQSCFYGDLTDFKKVIEINYYKFIQLRVNGFI